ncbi:VanZ family protein [Cellulophaga tyrosinoxydans]|uniref:VanZ like family protein n=1 Tax=Cellulophaga tyrosinoxydans TaxID=504486 RepID=A0A1W1YD53_9FLAO|nr:VanZ family protein [Cellulophaga tyrosinoxydans]SMC34082.1 VanZ like family protein [Cellulophaga tyrosinoxydans]
MSKFGGVSGWLRIPHKDKIVHFSFYFISTILGSFALREFSQKKISLNNAAVKMFLFSVVYGMIIEVLQYSITKDRHGDFYDFIANSIGAFCGLLLVKYFFSQRVSQK